MTALRVDLDPDDVGRGFTALVLALAEAVRELLERQAVRRIETGDLTPEQVERLGRTLLAVRQQLTAVRQQLEIETNRKDTT